MEKEKTLVIITFKGVRIEMPCYKSSFDLIHQTIVENKDSAIAFKDLTIPVKDICSHYLN